MEIPPKVEGSGYKGFGFKYNPVEWKQKMGKLIAKGKTELGAKTELITLEEAVRARQEITQQEQAPRRAA